MDCLKHKGLTKSVKPLFGLSHTRLTVLSGWPTIGRNVCNGSCKEEKKNLTLLRSSGAKAVLLPGLTDAGSSLVTVDWTTGSTLKDKFVVIRLGLFGGCGEFWGVVGV